MTASDKADVMPPAGVTMPAPVVPGRVLTKRGIADQGPSDVRYALRAAQERTSRGLRIGPMADTALSTQR